MMHDLLEFEYEPAVEVSNIVATAGLDSDLSLEALTLELSMEWTEYEPKQFLTLMYHDPEYVNLIFASGKLLCTELIGLEQILSAIDCIGAQVDSLKNLNLNTEIVRDVGNKSV